MPSSPAARRKARAKQRHVDALFDAALSRIRSMGLALRVNVVRRFRQGVAVDDAIAEVTEKMRVTLLDAMVAGHLQGRLDELTNAAAAGAVLDRGRRLDRLTDAGRFLTERLVLTDAEVIALNGTYNGEALNVANGFGAEVNRVVSQEIADSIAAGEHVDVGTKRLRGAFDRLGIPSADTPGHLIETIYRTQTQMAYSAGSWNADQDPAIQEILWGYGYVTVGDNKVRPTHAALDGTRLPKEDPQWNRIATPNGFRCRCTMVAIFKTDSTRIVEVRDRVSVPLDEGGTVTVIPGPDDGWDFNPGLVFRDALSVGGGRLRGSIPQQIKGRWRVLAALHTLGGRALQREIAEVAGRSRATVCERINLLAEEGFVEHDPAGHGCSLTAIGQQRAEACCARSD